MKFTVYSLIMMSLASLLAVGECRSHNLHKAGEPCCTARQFEIGFGATIGEAQESRTAAIQEYLRGAFDFDDRTYGMDVVVRQFGGDTTQYQIIQLFNKEEMYLVMGEQCFKLPLGPEPQRCIPDTADYTGSFYFGNTNPLLADNWFMAMDPAAGFEGEVYATTSSDDCTPIGVTAVGVMVDPQGNKVQVVESGGYFNFTEGIKEPDRWFVPPPSCDNSTLLAEDSTWQPIQLWKRMRATKVFL